MLLLPLGEGRGEGAPAKAFQNLLDNCNRSKQGAKLMQRETKQTSADIVDNQLAAQSIDESKNASDYPWFDPDDDLDDLNEPEELDLDDPHWDAFLADDDELDPEPAPGDFWPETKCE